MGVAWGQAEGAGRGGRRGSVPLELPPSVTRDGIAIVLLLLLLLLLGPGRAQGAAVQGQHLLLQQRSAGCTTSEKAVVSSGGGSGGCQHTQQRWQPSTSMPASMQCTPCQQCSCLEA